MTSAQPAHTTHPTHDRKTVNQLGLWLFMVSESCLFLAFLAGRFYLQGYHRPEELNQFLGLVITGVLLLSSLSAYRAEVASAHGDLKTFRTSMLATLAMGVVFTAGVAVEWVEAFHHFPPWTAFGTVFFSLTGLHAFHVITGLLILGFVFMLGRNGRFAHGNNWAVEGAVKYWHFVDVVWVFVYPTIYLVN